MAEQFARFFDLSEVWALLIPLYILQWKKKQPVFMKPVIFYLWSALLINFLADSIAEYNRVSPGYRFSNTPLYNLHSVLRFTCFTWFFYLLQLGVNKTLQILLLVLYLAYVAYQFIFAQKFFDLTSISGNLMAVESFMLLVSCLLYYFHQLAHPVNVGGHTKDFWVVTGLSIYVVANFFVFLFYKPMLTTNLNLALKMWNVHNLAFILLCIFISKAFYATARS